MATRRIPWYPAGVAVDSYLRRGKYIRDCRAATGAEETPPGENIMNVCGDDLADREPLVYKKALSRLPKKLFRTACGGMKDTNLLVIGAQRVINPSLGTDPSDGCLAHHRKYAEISYHQ